MELSKLTTKYIGRNIYYYEKLPSTQEKAKEMSSEKIKNGTIVIAEEQTAGRGTHGRTWQGNKENATFTIILYPKCDVSKIGELSIKIAEAICNAINEEYGHELEIKEPNDIMVNNKKIAGILTETITRGERVEELYIGIGLNINQQKFPEELQEIATSLKKEFKKEYNKNEIIAVTCNKIEEMLFLTKIIQ